MRTVAVSMMMVMMMAVGYEVIFPAVDYEVLSFPGC